jgi:hypothetical protein
MACRWKAERRELNRREAIFIVRELSRVVSGRVTLLPGIGN